MAKKKRSKKTPLRDLTPEERELITLAKELIVKAGDTRPDMDLTHIYKSIRAVDDMINRNTDKRLDPMREAIRQVRRKIGEILIR